MHDEILRMDDATAVRVLKTIAKAHVDIAGENPEMTDEMCRGLEEAFGVESGDGAPAEAELARAALLVLAQDVQMQQHIKALAASGNRRSMAIDPASAIGLSAAAVFVLNTAGKIRNVDGKWEFEVSWKPLDKEILKSFVEGITKWFKSGRSD